MLSVSLCHLRSRQRYDGRKWGKGGGWANLDHQTTDSQAAREDGRRQIERDQGRACDALPSRILATTTRVIHATKGGPIRGPKAVALAVVEAVPRLDVLVELEVIGEVAVVGEDELEPADEDAVHEVKEACRAGLERFPQRRCHATVVHLTTAIKKGERGEGQTSRKVNIP